MKHSNKIKKLKQISRSCTHKAREQNKDTNNTTHTIKKCQKTNMTNKRTRNNTPQPNNTKGKAETIALHKINKHHTQEDPNKLKRA